MQRHTHDVFVEASTVRKTFVTADDGEADREWACLSLLARHAPGLAPRPLRFTWDDERPSILMERLPGERLRPGPLQPLQLSALGAALRRVYAVPADAIASSGLPERRFGPTVLVERLSTALDRPADLTEVSGSAVVRSAMRMAREYVTNASQLPPSDLTCMGIADLNPANVLWDGITCRLVDFEDGGRTDPAFELADHVEHLASRLGGTYDPIALPDAVGLERSALIRYEAYRPLWATFWLLMLLPGHSAHTRNPPGTLENQAHHVHQLLDC